MSERRGERERERGRETERDGKKNNNMNFSLLSSMDFPLHHFSAGLDETKVIRETQVGHLRAITAKREHCLRSNANTSPHVGLFVFLSAIPDLCCRLLHNINNVNFTDWCACEGTHHEIDGVVIYHHLVSLVFFSFHFFTIAQLKDRMNLEKEVRVIILNIKT